MPAPAAQNLASAGRSAAQLPSKVSATISKKNKKLPSTSTSVKKKPSSPSVKDATLKSYVSAISSSFKASKAAGNLLKTFKVPPSSNISTSPPSLTLHRIFSDSLNPGCRINNDKLDLDWDDELEIEEPLGDVLDMPWIAKMSNGNVSPRRQEVSREKKQRWVFKNSQTGHISSNVTLCARRLGPDATLEIFGRLGRESGLKEYTSLINVCIEKARAATDEDASLEQIHKAHHIFTKVRENGFEIKEDMYGKFLLYIIDFGMVDKFFFFSDLIRDDNPDSLPRLAYYEMLLWIKVGNGLKIQELCRSVLADSSKEKSHLKDIKEENISNLICEYTISVPNLSVEDTIIKFQTLHAKLGVLPTSSQYEKLIRYSCSLHKVHEALNIVDVAFGSGVSL